MRTAAFAMIATFAAVAIVSAPAFAHGDHAGPATVQETPADEPLKPGSNMRLRSPISAAPGLEVIISDVIIPANSQVPPHYHPGEEFLYLIEGSARHIVKGQPERMLTAGASTVIPPRAIHAPIGGPDGARAIVFRVHVKDQPERVPVAVEELESE
jgi:quercetin dioxygenase-like cupin family protein